MKKLIFGLSVLMALPFLAKAAPDMAFYIYIFAIILAVVFVLGRSRKKPHSIPPEKDAAGFGNLSKRRRIISAVKAVRKNQMTVAQASQHYGVSEREIKTIHYLDYLLTY